MSVKTKLLLLVSLSIAASVGAVALLIEQRTHWAFRQIEEERTAGLVRQFQHEFDHEGDEITRGVDAIANSDSMLRTFGELSNGADYATHYKEAADYATAQRLDFLDLVAPDGTIISSYHWPARLGYKELWFLGAPAPPPSRAFLKHVETPQGNVLALLCLRVVRTHGLNFYVVGGRKLDAVLEALSPPEGVRISIYSAPEQGPGEFMGADKNGVPSANLMPLIQQAMDQRGQTSATIEWGPELPQEQIVHAIALTGYSDHVPAVLLIGNSLEQETNVEKNIFKVSLIIAGLGVLLGIIGSGLVAARISRPLKRLANAAAKVGQGDWYVRVESRSQDEIGMLAAAFNQMTEELISQRERLVQTERVAAWRELARRLAHELKNPLFPLQITVENLLRAREKSPQQFDEVFRESTSTLLAEITNLKTIIGRFSDFSKMPAPQIQAVDLDEIVRSVVQLFQGQLGQGPAKVEPELCLSELPAVAGDPVLLRRVIENLVLNAIDAMPQGGKLTFRTELNHQFAVFEIADTGQGLTREECDRLFTPYYTTKKHGTGLGLAIVQSVVSDHHGSITVSSTKNFGTTFHVELPLWDGEGEGEAEEQASGAGNIS